MVIVPENAQVTCHPIQEVMSRTGSFPLSVALPFLQRYGTKNAIVLDPFCGKGTTLLAARLLGYRAYGLDVAPEAIICSAAKLVALTYDSLETYLDTVRLGRPSLHDVPPAVTTFLHPDTLSQILSLRSRLQRDMTDGAKGVRSHATFAMACLLGILHGHASYSLSLPCAHAYSMSPAYVARYAAEHSLERPRRDVKSCLLAKARQLLEQPLPPTTAGYVRRGSALDLATTFRHLVGKVNIILTSPPYLDAQTYAKDNWLRLWLLGYDYRTEKASYIETGSICTYGTQMAAVLTECARMLTEGGRLICIAGDVRRRSRKQNDANGAVFRTGHFLATLVRTRKLGLAIEDTGRHSVTNTSRYFHSLSQSNGHCPRHLVERYFIARKQG